VDTTITLPEGYSFVDLDDGAKSDMVELLRWSFPTALSHEGMLAVPMAPEAERSVGVRTCEDGRLVAMHASHPWERFPLPGATGQAAGLTEVAVHPEHRRRGLLNAMMRLHLSRCVKRGEVLSILTATEPTIYGRYGYGHAADSLALKLSRGAGLRSIEGSEAVKVRVLQLDRARHTSVINAVHQAAGAQGLLARPGWAGRTTEVLQAAELYEHHPLRGGREELRLMLAERDGEAVGYALFQRNAVWENWGDGGPASTVTVKECVAIDGAAAHALWSRLLDLDLTSKIEAWPVPVDDPLIGMLLNVTAALALCEEFLWVRLVDVPAALAARQYSSDIDVILEIRDALLPANQGQWRVRARAFSAEVSVEAVKSVEVSSADAGTNDARSTSERPADLSLDIRELGAAYLGGTSLAALAKAGLVQARSDEALLRTAAAFLWPIAPGCTWLF
jgi:predicted acetyltransferase